METKIYLIRHAKVDYIPDDYSRPLSKQGEEEVMKLTESFREFALTRVVSSPYIRAVKTVSSIAEEKDLSIELLEDFRERKVSDGHIEDFDAFTKAQWEDFSYRLQGGESLEETQLRGITALNMLLDSYPGESIAVGTHGTILGTILNYYDKQYHYDFWRVMKMPDVFKLSFTGTELNKILHIQI